MLSRDETLDELTREPIGFKRLLSSLLFGDCDYDFDEHLWKLQVSRSRNFSDGFANVPKLPDGQRSFRLVREPHFYAGTPSAIGRIRVSRLEITKLAVTFDEVRENIGFDMDCTVHFEAFLEERTISGKTRYVPAGLFPIARDYHFGDTSILFGFSFAYIKVKVIPLKLLQLWAAGGLRDEYKGITIREHSEGQWIKYEILDDRLYGLNRSMIPKYTMEFINWFKRGGEEQIAKIFRKCKRARCIDLYDYNTIMKRLDLVRFIVPPTPSPAQVQKVKQKTDLVAKALDISKKDRIKLRTIRDYEGKSFSYSKWAELLGFSSKGALDPFFKRMKELGLIVVRKGGDGEGTQLKLTPDGQKVLAAVTP